MKQRIYLDYNATSPLRPEVKTAMLAAMELPGNPSSVHEPGRAARRVVEEARELVARSLAIKPVQVIFTSGGTESNNFALQAEDYKTRLISAIEHDSLERSRYSAIRIAVGPNGLLDFDDLEKQLKKAAPPVLVSVILANNETGVIQNLPDIARIVSSYSARLHTDAVQAYGKIPLDFAALGVDMMTISAHKVGGPKGAGALIVREGLPIRPFLTGGGQERSRRAGTENVPAIAGFGAFAAEISRSLEEQKKLESLRNHLENTALKRGFVTAVYAGDTVRLPNTSCLALPDMDGETKVLKTDLAGVAISSGSACSSGRITPSHVLMAMGFDERAARQAIRISLGWQTTETDINACLEALAA